MIWLPRNLAALAAVAERRGERYALSGLRVVPCREDCYRVEATDGKRLAVVCGPGVPSPVQPLPGGEEFPEYDGPVLVPREAWEQAFRQVKKGESLCLVPGDGEVVLATRGGVARVPCVEGRFPDVEQALPRTPPLVEFSVDPELLASLCKLARAVDGDGHTGRLTLLYYGPGRPLGLMAKGAGGQTLDCLLMPLEV
jgi:hypothetical protein